MRSARRPARAHACPPTSAHRARGSGRSGRRARRTRRRSQSPARGHARLGEARFRSSAGAARPDICPGSGRWRASAERAADDLPLGVVGVEHPLQPIPARRAERARRVAVGRRRAEDHLVGGPRCEVGAHLAEPRERRRRRLRRMRRAGREDRVTRREAAEPPRRRRRPAPTSRRRAAAPRAR